MPGGAWGAPPHHGREIRDWKGGGGLVGGKVGLLFRGMWAGWGKRVRGGGEGDVLHLEENNPVQQ